MSRTVLTIADVVELQLCTGCGVCAYVEPERFRMGDALDHGRRPHAHDGAADETGEAFAICPGVGLAHDFDRRDPALVPDLTDAWGPVHAVWEGFAADGEIRRAGSSGGAATALALYCIERGGMAGVLHTAARKDVAYLNETVMSTTRGQLLAATGSRYAPASPCDGLDRIERARAPCVFIGKPCDVAAVQRARKSRPALDEKIGVTIGFFCAGAPSTRGTLELLKKVGVKDPKSVTGLRYRGNGWPGMWRVAYSDGDGAGQTREESYAVSWDFLQRYRQWRCYVCPDHTGEFADIAVGDPWYREVQPDEPGQSLIVARTRRGREIVQAAADAGYLILETEDATLLPRSQPNLLGGRGALWARLIALRLLGAATPRYRGFETFAYWRSHLSLIGKIRSFTGTVKRVFTKNLRNRANIVLWTPNSRGDDE